jgi:hypothetical protein
MVGIEEAALSLTPEQISVLGGVLTAKERRLLLVLSSVVYLGSPRTVGDLCRQCLTTRRTLLRRTWPGLAAKARAVIAATEGIGA